MKVSGNSLLCIMFIFLLIDTSPSFAAEPAGEVENIVPKGWAENNGEKRELEEKGAVFVEDLLSTNDDGKFDVKFKDGTVIALGPQSEVEVNEFIMTDTKDSFNAGIIKGAARVVTGSLVKRNPAGFRIRTPRSTVGIRGTVVLFAVRGDDEIVSVQDMSAGSHVTIIDRSKGQRYTINAPGFSYVVRKGEAGRVVKNNDRIVSSLENLDEATQDGDKGFNEIIDSVLKEAEQEKEIEGSREIDQTKPVDTSSKETAYNLIEKPSIGNREAPDGRGNTNTRPAPRRVDNCD